MFVALVPPDSALEHLSEFLAPRQAAEPTFRWTAREQWHVTLAFMADVAERNLGDLTERLARAAARRPPLALSLHAGGAFPDATRAKVLFAGVDAATSAEELRRLSTGTRSAAAKAGAAPGGGRFHPHVTLARLRAPVDATRWVRIVAGYRGPGWGAGEMALVESHLGQGPRRRPRYTVVETFPLGARA